MDMTRTLADLTEQELLELAAANPKVYKALADSDPRVRLYEAVYNADGTLKVDGKDRKFSEVIEEMGVRIAPASSLARARRHAAEAIADDVAAVKNLRKELEADRARQAEQKFEAEVRESATELGFTVGDKDLADIVTFMKENEYGAKAVRKAVEAFYEGREPAEPTFDSEHTFQFEDEGSDYIKTLTTAPPFTDTSQDTLRHAEHVWNQMFGKGGPGAAKRAMVGR